MQKDNTTESENFTEFDATLEDYNLSIYKVLPLSPHYHTEKSFFLFKIIMFP